MHLISTSERTKQSIAIVVDKDQQHCSNVLHCSQQLTRHQGILCVSDLDACPCGKWGTSFAL